MLKRAAWLLAFVALAALVAAALFAWSRRPVSLSDGGVSVTVPRGWRVVSAREGIVYGSVRLERPAVFGADWCDHHSRAFFGLAKGSFAAVTQQWADAIGATPRIGDGRADAEVAVLPGRCQPLRVHLTVLDAGARQLVLMRDVGSPGDLTDRAAERIIESVRR